MYLFTSPTISQRQKDRFKRWMAHFPEGLNFPSISWLFFGNCQEKKKKKTNTNMLQKLNAKNRRKEKINYKRKSVDS